MVYAWPTLVDLSKEIGLSVKVLRDSASAGELEVFRNPKHDRAKYFVNPFYVEEYLRKISLPKQRIIEILEKLSIQQTLVS